MKQIELTKGYFATVDDEDYERVAQFNWCATVKQQGVYAVRGKGPRGKMKMIYLHRFLLGAVAGQYVDHVDGDSLNNRRDNLRLCSGRANVWNQKRKSSNRSGYKGVCWDKSRRLWKAEIRAVEGRIHIGRFEVPEDAAKAYDAAARKHHGEFATLNFPEVGERAA
jgi:hypothetical protein